MRKKRIVKIISVIVVALIAKVTIFGWWHFHSFRELVANVLLPIGIHILGGLGTVFLAWWLIDENVRSQAKREEWERVLAKAFSDLRRDVWLAGELTLKGPALGASHVFGRYWVAGLDELRLRLPKEHLQLEHKLWSLIHQFDVCNKMLEVGALAEAAQQAPVLIEQMKELGPSLQQLGVRLVDLEVEQRDFAELFDMKEDDNGFLKFTCPVPSEMAFR